MLQLMGPAGIPDLVTAESDPEDWLWKTVRKGVAPAFAAQAMKSVAVVFRRLGCFVICQPRHPPLKSLCEFLTTQCGVSIPLKSFSKTG